MTGRERVRAAIPVRSPDRIPLIYGILPGAEVASDTPPAYATFWGHRWHRQEPRE
ncbi:MAG: hypothetical protein ACOYEW_09695 [Anaerolineae bacterium]|jgi:hypothetical protein